MSTAPHDTIAAISTPPGYGGVGIVRLSGAEAERIALRLLPVDDVPPRQACFADFHDLGSQLIDQGLVLRFVAPHSFTGEHVVELHGHGGPVVMQRLLSATIEAGARLAQPGEFSQRAFLNGKIDLAQAEAIADLIAAGSAQAARAAAQSLSGRFSNRIDDLQRQLTELRTWVEAALDFSDEEIDFLGDTEIAARLQYLQQSLQTLLATSEQGQLLRDGFRIAIVGAPNVGKSSLLNRLVDRELAIVTDIAGTTRDVIEGAIHLDGLPIQLIDTAGLRGLDQVDAVEKEGIRRALAAAGDADRILWITSVDQASKPIPDELQRLDVPVDKVLNKIDLARQDDPAEPTTLAISAKTGAGIARLREHLKQVAGYQPHAEGVFIARTRHIRALQIAQTHVDQAVAQMQAAQFPEIIAEELTLAQRALSEITGEFTTEDLLGEIFGSFCIGK